MSSPKQGWLSKLLGGSASPPERVIHFCAGPNCCRPDQGRAAYEHLLKRLDEIKSKSGKEPAGCVKAACFSVCGEGPVACVMPERVWYSELTGKNLDRVIDEHLVKGKVVSELTFEAPIEARRLKS